MGIVPLPEISTSSGIHCPEHLLDREAADVISVVANGILQALTIVLA